MEIAKAGWVHRQSSVLKRWKRCWLVLYQSGRLAHFESPEKHEPDEVYYLPGRLSVVRRGNAIPSKPTAPDGRSPMDIIQLMAANGEEMFVFCAESDDDAVAWNVAIDQARIQQQRVSSAPMYGGAPPPYQQAQGYNQQVPVYTSQQQVPYNYAQPPTTIIVQQDPYPHGYGYGYGDPYYGGFMGPGLGTGLAMGALLGMGMGGWHHHGCYW